ncbi:MAG: hypothetical protein N3A38_09720 [Planctomycetota bacterium]|nr:hypothetical protein [Planctomycetota bacterium]
MVRTNTDVYALARTIKVDVKRWYLQDGFIEWSLMATTWYDPGLEKADEIEIARWRSRTPLNDVCDEAPVELDYVIDSAEWYGWIGRQKVHGLDLECDEAGVSGLIETLYESAPRPQ